MSGTDSSSKANESGDERDSVPEDISTTDEPVYPSPIRLILITISLSFSIFLVALDRTIIAPAM